MPANTCSPDKIIAALYEEAEIVTDIVREKIESSDRFMLRMIPDGGVVRRHANNDTIIYGEAFQAPIAYKELNHDVKPLVSGEMLARSQGGASALFTTDINDIDDNACHGQCTIEFAQGFRRRGTKDYGLSVDTPIKCARELDRLGESHIRGYFEGFKNSFSQWGYDNYSENLMNLVIANSESNFSFLGANQFNVTTGGWQAPPEYGLTIHGLQDYARYIKRLMRGFGMDVPEDWMLTVEVPEQDWADAVKLDQVARNPTGTVYNSEVFKDDEGPLRGRRSATYGGIRAIFNEEPIRGYFKQTGIVAGNATFEFVRVFPYINERDEIGGVVKRGNFAYDLDAITVGGITYEMVTLIPHIHPKSFKRYGLVKPLKPIGDANAGVNYDVRIIEGARLQCNDFDDKFKFAARHEFRLKFLYPELSGFLAYRHGLRTGYVNTITPRNNVAGPDNFAGPETFQLCGPDGCQQAGCESCNKVSDANGVCQDPGAAPAAVLNLVPCGTVNVAFLGDAMVATFEVERTGGTAGAVSVDYTTADGTATQPGDYTTTAGTLNWAAGETGSKTISVPIPATFAETTPGTAVAFTLTISAPVGATLGTCTVATVTVEDFSDDVA